MHPLDKAQGLAQLVKRTGSEQDAARATGLGIQTVRKYLKVLELPEDLRIRLGASDGPNGVGVLSRLAQTFTTDEERREAYDKIHGFKGGDGEAMLKQSGGDMGSLDMLREQALQGTFNVVRCGADLLSCPWVEELPEQTQERVIAALDD